MNEKQIEEKMVEIEGQISTLQEELKKLIEKEEKLIQQQLEESDDTQKGVCNICGGLGYTQKDESKQICPLCKGNGWIWFKLYKK